MIQPLAYNAPLADYYTQSQELLQLCRSRDKKALEFMRAYNLRLQKLSDVEFDQHEFIQQDTDEALLSWYHFKAWSELSDFTVAVSEQEAAAQFEQAADAIAMGDIATLSSILKKNPALVHARSMRWHRSTLLHYVGANGVEGYRQKSPSNSVEVLNLLIQAGADVNATAGMYGGGSTTFGLTATSIWPAKAGVLVALLETLLKAGAVVEGPEGGAIVACLHNGRPEAAAALVRYGASLDMEAAVGVGKLDVVKTFFNADGTLKDEANRPKMEEGFMWACEFGHVDVAKYLLGNGLDPNVQVKGMNGLHWAMLGGQLEIVQLLIANNADIEAENMYGGTALECCLWSIVYSDPVYRWPDASDEYPTAIVTTLLRAGAKTRPGLLKWWDTLDVRENLKRGITDLLKKYGAIS